MGAPILSERLVKNLTSTPSLRARSPSWPMGQILQGHQNTLPSGEYTTAIEQVCQWLEPREAEELNQRSMEFPDVLI